MRNKGTSDELIKFMNKNLIYKERINKKIKKQIDD